MNITPSTIYWISVLDNVACCAGIFALVSAISTAVLLGAIALELEDRPALSKLLKISLCALAASVATGVFTPSAKTCAAMYVIPAIANSEKLQGVTDGLYDLAAEWLKELKPDKSKGEKGEGK